MEKISEVDQANVQKLGASPRPLRIDVKREQSLKGLNAELKFLYTAITRAKTNLWIYDEDKNRRLPGFHYFLARDLARIAQTEDNNENLFASPSSTEAWKKQGDYLLSKELFEHAITCYQKANEPQLQYSTAGIYYFVMARNTADKNLYQAGAVYFLEADKIKHSSEFVKKAARCLMDGNYNSHSARLYEAIGEVCSI